MHIPDKNAAPIGLLSIAELPPMADVRPFVPGSRCAKSILQVSADLK
jgi:hypothetical protein